VWGEIRDIMATKRPPSAGSSRAATAAKSRPATQSNTGNSILDREAEYMRLNAELQQRTAFLMKQTEQVECHEQPLRARFCNDRVKHASMSQTTLTAGNFSHSYSKIKVLSWARIMTTSWMSQAASLTQLQPTL
jgi:hypothetical protein